MYVRGVILLLAFGAACGRADRDVVVESGTRFLADEQVSAWFGEWSISGSPFLSIRQVSGGVAVIDPFDEQNWRHTARLVTFDGQTLSFELVSLATGGSAGWPSFRVASVNLALGRQEDELVATWDRVRMSFTGEDQLIDAPSQTREGVALRRMAN